MRDGANKALNRLVGFLLKEGAAVRVYSPTMAAGVAVVSADAGGARALSLAPSDLKRLSA